jgi:hypothetical protein
MTGDDRKKNHGRNDDFWTTRERKATRVIENGTSE